MSTANQGNASSSKKFPKNIMTVERVSHIQTENELVLKKEIVKDGPNGLISIKDKNSSSKVSTSTKEKDSASKVSKLNTGKDSSPKVSTGNKEHNLSSELDTVYQGNVSSSKVPTVNLGIDSSSESPMVNQENDLLSNISTVKHGTSSSKVFFRGKNVMLKNRVSHIKTENGQVVTKREIVKYGPNGLISIKDKTSSPKVSTSTKEKDSASKISKLNTGKEFSSNVFTVNLGKDSSSKLPTVNQRNDSFSKISTVYQENDSSSKVTTVNHGNDASPKVFTVNQEKNASPKVYTINKEKASSSKVTMLINQEKNVSSTVHTGKDCFEKVTTASILKSLLVGDTDISGAEVTTCTGPQKCQESDLLQSNIMWSNKRGDRGRLCAAVNCDKYSNSYPKVSFFRFPKDEQRSKQWAINAGRVDLKNTPMELLRTNYFCASHFEDNMFMNKDDKSRLLWNAVPTKFTSFVQPCMAPVRCAALHCNNDQDTPLMSFFRFPTDRQRCKQWVINCKRNDLAEVTPCRLNRSYRLCADHFEDRWIIKRKKTKLKGGAVPTKFHFSNLPHIPENEIKREPPVDELDNDMPTCCCVPRCSSRGGVQFPQNDDTLFAKWIHAIGRRDENGGKWYPSSTRAVVCHAHFTDDDYKKTLSGARRRLKKYAVPSVFPLKDAPFPVRSSRKEFKKGTNNTIPATETSCEKTQEIEFENNDSVPEHEIKLENNDSVPEHEIKLENNDSVPEHTMTLCVVPLCGTRHGFGFPRDPEVRKAWTTFVRNLKIQYASDRMREAYLNWEPSIHAVVCKAHFDETQMKKLTYHGTEFVKERLIPGSVPHIFNLPEKRSNKASSSEASQTCCVPYCRPGSVGSTLHAVPVLYSPRLQWLEAMRMLSTVSEDQRFVCDQHFTEDDYVTTSKKETPKRSFRDSNDEKCLKPEAIPSVFPWTQDIKSFLLRSKGDDGFGLVSVFRKFKEEEFADLVSKQKPTGLSAQDFPDAIICKRGRKRLLSDYERDDPSQDPFPQCILCDNQTTTEPARLATSQRGHNELKDTIHKYSGALPKEGFVCEDCMTQVSGITSKVNEFRKMCRSLDADILPCTAFPGKRFTWKPNMIKPNTPVTENTTKHTACLQNVGVSFSDTVKQEADSDSELVYKDSEHNRNLVNKGLEDINNELVNIKSEDSDSELVYNGSEDKDNALVDKESEDTDSELVYKESEDSGSDSVYKESEDSDSDLVYTELEDSDSELVSKELEQVDTLKHIDNESDFFIKQENKLPK